MQLGYRKLSKDDLNGDAALDTAGTAKEGVLQRLEARIDLCGWSHQLI